MERLKTTTTKIQISSAGFKLGTNLKINLDGEKDKPDVKSNKEQKHDIKPNIEFKKEDKQDVKMIKTEPGMDKITYEEEKVGLVLGITAVFTVWWMFK